MQDVHFMHVLQALADLPYEQHSVQLRQVVVLVDDAVKQLSSFHTAVQTYTVTAAFSLLFFFNLH